MTQPLLLKCDVNVVHRQRGQKTFRDGEAPRVASGRVPRISRLMALAIHCEQLVRDGLIADQTELTQCGHISKSSLTQILSLLNLATCIQEEILFLPNSSEGRGAFKERDVRKIAAIVDWGEQWERWRRLQARVGN